MEKLIARYRELLDNTDMRFLRYMHQRIDWDNRMLAIVGARGVGKTTLLLQHIRQNLPADDAIYVNADDFYFSTHRLLDFAEQFHKSGGRYLFVDEIHKYEDWSREMKLIYDYLPSLKVVITGSSVLDIFRGSADLSRRVILYKMQGLSFREYLNFRFGLNLPAYTLEEILEHKVRTDEVEFPLKEFDRYLQSGYYPFFVQPDYESKLLQTIQNTLETDIPIYARLSVSTAAKLRQLLAIIAESVPFKPNYSKLASLIGIDRETLKNYFNLMQRAGLIKLLHEATSGIRLLGKVEKVYLENTNQSYVLASPKPERGNLRETFFFNQLSQSYEVTASPVADFLIEGKTFEVGGKAKGQRQIESVTNGYIVKDDILHGHHNVIPLWHFGFLY